MSSKHDWNAELALWSETAKFARNILLGSDNETGELWVFNTDLSMFLSRDEESPYYMFYRDMLNKPLVRRKLRRIYWAISGDTLAKLTGSKQSSQGLSDAVASGIMDARRDVTKKIRVLLLDWRQIWFKKILDCFPKGEQNTWVISRGTKNQKVTFAYVNRHAYPPFTKQNAPAVLCAWRSDKPGRGIDELSDRLGRYFNEAMTRVRDLDTNKDPSIMSFNPSSGRLVCDARKARAALAVGADDSGIDAVIHTAMRAERKAVVAALKRVQWASSKALTSSGKVEGYWKAFLNVGKLLKIAVVCTEDENIGPPDAAALCAAVITRLQPQHYVLCGVAASLCQCRKHHFPICSKCGNGGDKTANSCKPRVGDLVVPTMVYGYDFRKVSGPSRIRDRWRSYPVQPVGAAVTELGESVQGWASGLVKCDECRKAVKRCSVRVHRDRVGMCSGSDVIANAGYKAEFVTKTKSFQHDVLAVEMESVGIGAALGCLKRAFPECKMPSWCVIKCISDYGNRDEKKNQRQAWASQIAARGAVTYVLSALVGEDAAKHLKFH